LSSFSDLIRSVLEMSSEQFVRIQDEIRLCKLYVELESILLEDDFEFNLQIDPELEAKRIDIPALFIQPFIENSFKHGLRHKKGMKKLKLSFKLDRNENVVLVCIEDNGVGRKESALINAQSLKTHTSFATQAIEKRMVLLNSGNTEMVQVEIIDLIENKSAKGTKVQIKFHMNESE
jgi:LytS/YehU family sensor histidine kinase